MVQKSHGKGKGRRKKDQAAAYHYFQEEKVQGRSRLFCVWIYRSLGKEVPTSQRKEVWQNRLNYSGSSALVIAIQAILTQRTSNGTTHWSVGSPPDTTTVQQDRSSFTSHESEFTITPPLSNFSFTEIINIITNYFKLNVNLYKHCLTQQAKQLVQSHSGRNSHVTTHVMKVDTTFSPKYGVIPEGHCQPGTDPTPRTS
jgi:hypothetical protein